MKKFDPYLLILMRNDLASMTPGRAAAQASHATSDFHMAMEPSIEGGGSNIETLDPEKINDCINAYNSWKSSTVNFGTTIVVGVDEMQMCNAMNKIQNDYVCGYTNDPTYAVRDGSVTHYVNLTTCAWIFVSDDQSDHFDDLKRIPLF